MTTRRKKRTKFRSISIVAIFLLAISVVALILTVSDAINTNDTPYLTTTLTIIFGTTTILTTLIVAAIMFTVLGLANEGEALGLPSGSVRALIALLLIIIFAIMVVFMHADMTRTPLTYENGTYVFDDNGALLYDEPFAAQIDFSKQILTTISTLVVAVAGFYFGTQAVKTAKGTAGEEEEELTIQSVTISSAPSVTLLVQSSVGTTLGGIIIKDAKGTNMGTFATSDVIPNDGSLTTVTSTSWTKVASGTIAAGQSYTATITTTKGSQVTSAPVKAT